MKRRASPQTSIIVVSYEMARVLPRTVVSLCPPYQRPVSGGVEIIVVDNGSKAPPLEADFAGLALPVRVVRAPTPSPSPVGAINHGLSLAAGEIVGVWIDGARLASPGLVAASTRACADDPRTVAATPNYHLGRVPQYRVEARTYSAEQEDGLLAAIDWPRGDGYRLFEIAHPADLSGLDGPMLETNALFMTRQLWDELGGYDPAFVSPGGGAANPDIFARALARPGTRLTLVKGEANFHQIHGGVTSNATDSLEALKALSAEYWRIRGKGLMAWRGPVFEFDATTGTRAVRATTYRDADGRGSPGRKG